MIAKLLFCFAGLMITALITVLFIRFMKWLGDKGGEFSILKDNYRILIQLATMLIFAFMVAVLLYVYQQIFGDLFNF